MRYVRNLATLVGVLVVAPLVLVVMAANPAGAVSEPNVIVGTYSWNAGGGYRVTVGFAPCGHSFPGWDENGNPVTVFDPRAQYYAKVKKGGASTVQIWAHDPTDLNGRLVALYGFGLSAEAWVTLDEDAATYACTA